MGTLLALSIVLGSLGGVADLDRDGVSDTLEQALIEQFRPHFHVDADECAQVPAEFEAFSVKPRVQEHNAAIYARVSPSSALGPGVTALELQYYHLWENDCGVVASHPLDVERVVALLVPNDNGWKALYWYAAAHEGTVCDTSNAAAAATLGARSSGPRVWISAGKHASYLDPKLCGQRGCGGDHCREMVDLPPGPLINLGEAQVPLNGAVWTTSKEWPFASKLGTVFNSDLIAQLEASDGLILARVNGRLRPTQFSISIAGEPLEALDTASRHAGVGVEQAEKKTGNALAKSWGATVCSLSHTARALGHVARAVGITKNGDREP
jgi:hypothetical protein